MYILFFTVTVATEPRLKVPTEKMNKNVNENTLANCVAEVPDKGLITEMKWYTPDGKEIPISNEYVF